MIHRQLSLLFIFFLLLTGLQQVSAQNLNGEKILIAADALTVLKFNSEIKSYQLGKKDDFACQVRDNDNSIVIKTISDDPVSTNLVISEGKRSHYFVLIYTKKIDLNNTKLFYDYSDMKVLKRIAKENEDAQKNAPAVAVNTEPAKKEEDKKPKEEEKNERLKEREREKERQKQQQKEQAEEKEKQELLAKLKKKEQAEAKEKEELIAMAALKDKERQKAKEANSGQDAKKLAEEQRIKDLAEAKDRQRQKDAEEAKEKQRQKDIADAKAKEEQKKADARKQQEIAEAKEKQRQKEIADAKEAERQKAIANAKSKEEAKRLEIQRQKALAEQKEKDRQQAIAEAKAKEEQRKRDQEEAKEQAVAEAKAKEEQKQLEKQKQKELAEAKEAERQRLIAQEKQRKLDSMAARTEYSYAELYKKYPEINFGDAPVGQYFTGDYYSIADTAENYRVSQLVIGEGGKLKERSQTVNGVTVTVERIAFSGVNAYFKLVVKNDSKQDFVMGINNLKWIKEGGEQINLFPCYVSSFFPVMMPEKELTMVYGCRAVNAGDRDKFVFTMADRLGKAETLVIDISGKVYMKELNR